MANRNSPASRKSGRTKAARQQKTDAPTSASSASTTPAWQWFILSAAVPLVLCARRLGADLWYDEAYTLHKYIAKPFLDIATDYSAPNNHVGFSLLMRLYVVALEPFLPAHAFEAVLRFPSFCFAAATLVLLFHLARRLAGLECAVMATAMLGLSQMFLNFAVGLRGYGLSMLLAIGLCHLALTQTARRRALRYGLIVFVGAGFVYVLPTNLLLLAPLSLLAVVMSVRQVGFTQATFVEVAVWAAAWLLAGLLYVPIYDQVLAARGAAAAAPVTVVAAGFFRAALHDALPLVAMLPVGLALWWMRVRNEPESDRFALPALALSTLAVPFLLAAVLQISPFTRNFCPLLPPLAILWGWLLSEVLIAARRFIRPLQSANARAVTGLVLVTAALLPWVLTYSARLTEIRRERFAQDGYYEYYAANFHPSDVIAHLKQSIPPNEHYVLCYHESDAWNLVYYLNRYGLDQQRPGPESARESSIQPAMPTRTVYYIEPASPPKPDDPLICETPLDELQAATLVKDFGYYRLRRSRWQSAMGTP